MRKLELIEHSLQQAKLAGLKIERRPLFHWKEHGRLYGCCALGAVLWHAGKARPGFPKGWLKELCELLGTGTYWFWRFNQGWSNDIPLTLITEKDGKEVKIIDDVSNAAVKLARRYVDHE